MKNKISFTTSLAVILLNIFFIQANAQHVSYTYDANGNRTGRQYSAMRLRSENAQNDAKANEVAAQYGIGVYPNPLMDGSNVTVAISSASEKAGEEATVYVLDNTGKVLFSQQQTTASPSTLDLSGYTAGVYYVKVAVGKEELFYKIMKTK